MGGFSLGDFFEALFKYGKDYGLGLWHFLGLGLVGLFLWVGSRVARGAGKAVAGAQNVYLKMIEDLQVKADRDRADQEARVAQLRAQLMQTREDYMELRAVFDEMHAHAVAAASRYASLQIRAAEAGIPIPSEAPLPTPPEPPTPAPGTLPPPSDPPPTPA